MIMIVFLFFDFCVIWLICFVDVGMGVILVEYELYMQCEIVSIGKIFLFFEVVWWLEVGMFVVDDWIEILDEYCVEDFGLLYCMYDQCVMVYDVVFFVGVVSDNFVINVLIYFCGLEEVWVVVLVFGYCDIVLYDYICNECIFDLFWMLFFGMVVELFDVMC